MASKRCEPGCTCGRHFKPPLSPEEVARLRGMAANRLGARSSDEHRRRISAALTGKPLSDEHRAVVAAINADPELCKKKAASRKTHRKPAENHRQVHKRLVRDRGSASDHLCVDCSGQAEDWSHDWPTWEDVAQEIQIPRSTFSTNLDAYVPRCTPCHNRLDDSPAAWNLGGGRRGSAKLTEADIAWIRASRGRSQRAMARHVGVSQSTIWHILQGHTWKYLLAQ